MHIRVVKFYVAKCNLPCSIQLIGKELGCVSKNCKGKHEKPKEYWNILKYLKGEALCLLKQRSIKCGVIKGSGPIQETCLLGLKAVSPFSDIP